MTAQSIKRSVVVLFAAAFALAAPLSAQTVAWLDIEGSLAERQDPYAAMFGAPKPTLRSTVEAIERAGERDDVVALVIRLREPALTMVQVEEIGAAMNRVRGEGKQVHLFNEIYGPTELVLGSFADEVMAQAGAAVSLPGLHMEEFFLRDALATIGVQPDFVQIGDYKGASEPFANAEPSDAWNQNISRLLDSMYENLREHIKRGYAFDDAELNDVMEEAWLVPSERAQELGLVDLAIDRLKVDKHLEDLYGDFEYDASIGDVGGPGLDAMSNPFALFEALSAPSEVRVGRDSIAVLHINGAIIDGESVGETPLGGGGVGSLTIRKALKQIEDEPLIRGMIVRINSPGGSAIASESIWLGVRRVAEKKPVWVSVGDMAASGGYYIGVSGDRIYVNPASIVGSIGVVGGKFALGGMYEKLRVNVVPRSRGPQADLFDTTSGWSEAERALVRDRMKQTYDLFVKRVRAGRPSIDISKTAAGRLFTGETAVDLKMADAIGGLDKAVSDLADRLNLRPGAFDLVNYPAPKTFAEALEEAFGGFVAAPNAVGERSAVLSEVATMLRLAVGDRAWPRLRDSLTAMLQMRTEPVLLVTPSVLLSR